MGDQVWKQVMLQFPPDVEVVHLGNLYDDGLWKNK